MSFINDLVKYKEQGVDLIGGVDDFINSDESTIASFFDGFLTTPTATNVQSGENLTKDTNKIVSGTDRYIAQAQEWSKNPLILFGVGIFTLLAFSLIGGRR